MGNLSKITLKSTYSSDNDNVIRDFIVSCMKESIAYRRGVGYFTSASLVVAARGISHLVHNGGTVKLIASPNLTEQDIEALNTGYHEPQSILQDCISREFEPTESQIRRDRFTALAWLVASGHLQFKIATRVDADGTPLPGIYHEKIGILSDPHENHVAFSGSANETEAAYIANYEVIDVFRSWGTEAPRVADKINRFEELWNDTRRGVKSWDFTQQISNLLRPYTPDSPPPPHDSEEDNPPLTSAPVYGAATFQIPETVTLRPYQRQAVNSWLENNAQGIMAMATGTGKTITALAAVAELHETYSLGALLIIVPYKHLVEQWDEECRKFSLVPLLAYENKNKWMEDVNIELYRAAKGTQLPSVIITTYKSFTGKPFQRLLPRFPPKSALIVDEVHNAGSSGLRSRLPTSMSARIGLSATPERSGDPEGTTAIEQYFGKVLEPRLGLKEAIDAGALVPYRYFPITVELNDEERAEYLELSREIAQKWFTRSDPLADPSISTLLFRRARIVGTCEAKLDALRSLLVCNSRLDRTLIYCGDGTVQDPVTTDEIRHLDAVEAIVSGELGYRCGRYTAETSQSERQKIQQTLSTGEIDAALAIRCLDEGVDIPAVRNAIILASSANPRQFIQRRGRILRKAPGKDSAAIYDMVVVPPVDEETRGAERTLFSKELRRIAQFADAAINGPAARAAVFEIQKRFGLTHI